MAQKVSIILTDDLDPSKTADETVTFGLDGNTYEIDLTAKNADKFKGLFQDYIAVARKVGKKTGTAGRRTNAPSDAKEIRAWAASMGHDVPSRGRIPSAVREAFEAAN